MTARDDARREEFERWQREVCAPAEAAVLDDLTAARVRHALRELDVLEPALVEEFLAHPKYGPILTAALDRRRRWSCPLCGEVLYSEHTPRGWLVVEPFTRVAACSWCRGHITATKPTS